MKILFIITNLASGGAERVCATLANELSKEHEVEILYFKDEVFYELHSSVKLSLYKPKGRGIARIIDKMLKIRSKCDESDFTLSFMLSTNILSIMSNLFSGNKIIISEHSQHKFASLKWRVLRRIFYPFAHALGVLSKQDFEFYNFVKNRALIYNPTDCKPCFEAKKENLIIFVGRLERVKGCDIFLNALALLDLRDFEVRILGDGSLKQDLKQIAKNLGLNVNFLGNVKNVDEHYKSAKIIVSSSISEGLPMVLIESLFFDCIRVATPTTGATELINDEIDGFLSSDFRAENLALAIKKAMSASDEILTNARTKCENFKAQNIAKKWLELAK